MYCFIVQRIYTIPEICGTLFLLRVRMLGHWGKKTMYETFKYKPCNRKRSRWMLRGKTWGKKYWRKHKPISDVICGDLRGRYHSFYKNWAILKKKKATSSTQRLCVCLSVFFLADATHPLGVPGPAGAGPRQIFMAVQVFLPLGGLINTYRRCTLHTRGEGGGQNRQRRPFKCFLSYQKILIWFHCFLRFICDGDHLLEPSPSTPPPASENYRPPEILS